MAWMYRPAVNYRQHSRSITRDALGEAIHIERLLRKFFARTDIPKSVRKLESSVYFHSTVWSAWRMYQTGQSEHVSAWLCRSWPYSPYAPDHTVLEWAHQFVLDQNSNPQGMEDWLPHLREAVSEVLPTGVSAEALLWWLNVWWHYEEKDGAGISALQAFHYLDEERLLELAKTSLVLTQVDHKVEVVETFWNDTLTVGLVPPSRRYKVTILYLTVFGQATLARQWRTARAALGRAIYSSSHPRAIASWWGFSRAAFVHFYKNNARRPGMNEGDDRGG